MGTNGQSTKYMGGDFSRSNIWGQLLVDQILTSLANICMGWGGEGGAFTFTACELFLTSAIVVTILNEKPAIKAKGSVGE